VLKFCEKCGTLKDAVTINGKRTLVCPRCDPDPRVVKRSTDSWAAASTVVSKEPRYKTNYETQTQNKRRKKVSQGRARSKSSTILPNTDNSSQLNSFTAMSEVVEKHFKSNESLKMANWEEIFPYEQVRPQQKIIMNMLEKEVTKGKHVAIEAANGVGKTIAALAALIPIANQKKLRLVYVCRTHEQSDRVMSELEELNHEHSILGLSLRGKYEMCMNDLVLDFGDPTAAPDICWQLKITNRCPYYSNMQDERKLKQVLSKLPKGALSAPLLMEICKEQKVCPFEFSRLLLPFAKVVAGSYLYLFNSLVRRAFLGYLTEELSGVLMVVDEAHNLAPTCIEIGSAFLSDYSLSRALNEADEYGLRKTEFFVEKVVEEMDHLTRGLRDSEKPVDPKELLDKLSERMGETIDQYFAERILEEADEIKKELIEMNRPPISYLSSLGKFFALFIETIGKEEYFHMLETGKNRHGHKTIKLGVVALDPRTTSNEIFNEVYSSVSMSGSLQPKIYSILLGFGEEMVMNVLPSPYAKENAMCLVTKELTTRYQQRTQEMYEKIKEVIIAASEATPKNIGIYFTSYKLLEQLRMMGLEARLEKPVYSSSQGMSSRESDKLVTKFKKKAGEEGAVLLAVMGGRSSEGSDFPGELMQTVVVVGVPYARPTARIQASIDYYNEKFDRRGQLYGYSFPAAMRASQAAGRPLRSLKDRAAIILLDTRFGDPAIKFGFPSWIQENMEMVGSDPEEIGRRIKKFHSK
jgi:DNA excision repair protein ERCC-2